MVIYVKSGVFRGKFYPLRRGRLMKKTDKKAKELNNGMIYANNRIWTEDQLSSYRQYQTSYIKEKYRTFVLRFSKTKDKDIIEYIESKKEATAYIKDLIIADMNENNKEN